MKKKSANKFSTMPLRFRVWDKEDKNFLITSRIQDGYELIHIEQDISDVAALIAKFGRDRLVISQDTGLKDKNWKSIYTGDILFNGGWYIEVKYEDGEVLGYNSTEDTYYGILHNMQLRGNVWQNPELLDEE